MTEPYPQPRKRTNVAAIVAIGCAVAFFLFIAFIAFIFTVVFGAMRVSTPYKAALARAQTDPRVIAVLGKPIEAGVFVTGSINTNNGTGQANLQIPIRGPKGKAKIRVVGTKSGGVWSYGEMIVTPDAGEPINLLASTPESTSTAPPGD